MTSDEALALDKLPDSIVIVGGGYIALEFAGIFQGLGVDVTLMFRQHLPLRGFDTDLRKTVRDNLERRNIDVRQNCSPLAIKRAENGSLTISTNSGDIHTEVVMFATGRKPNTSRPDLGLANIGVQLDADGAIIVDEYSRTSVQNVWAVVSSVVDKQLTKPNYSNIPCAVFSQPPVGTVGLSEEQAVEEGYDCDIYCSEFTPMRSTLAGRQEKTFMKLVVDQATDLVLGVHMVGVDSPEILQGFATALQCGATKKHFDSTVGIHPSSAEEFVTMRTKTRSAGNK
jgi:glutathione reductase (NADPH)